MVFEQPLLNGAPSSDPVQLMHEQLIAEMAWQQNWSAIAALKQSQSRTGIAEIADDLTRRIGELVNERI